MAITLRQATPDDALQWIDLLVATVGADYPAREAYDPGWVAMELASTTDHETWVAEDEYRLLASISLLHPDNYTNNPVANLGRSLQRPESYADGSAAALLAHVTSMADERQQMSVARVPAANAEQQRLYSEAGYACVGFQPLKHLLQSRQGILFYVRAADLALLDRVPVIEMLPSLKDLAALALENLRLPTEFLACDGLLAYTPSAELEVCETTYADFAMWHKQTAAACLPPAVSTGFNRGCGLLRTRADAMPSALLVRRDTAIIGGLAYMHDEVDRCLRILDAFTTDDAALGPLFEHIVNSTLDHVGASYVELDLLAEAPRLAKTLERLGFQAVAYLPAFFRRDAHCLDVVKMVKLNILYESEYTPLTDAAAAVVRIVDSHFDDARHGMAMVNLLRALPIFAGLGDGELAKIARLFSQRLFRAGEPIFKKGDEGMHAYVVMRGQVGVYLNNQSQPAALVQAGQILGELAFLDNAPRSATAAATSASVLLVVERVALEELIRQEPYLGYVIMRNVALDLSRKLRRTNISKPETATAFLRR